MFLYGKRFLTTKITEINELTSLVINILRNVNWRQQNISEALTRFSLSILYVYFNFLFRICCSVILYCFNITENVKLYYKLKLLSNLSVFVFSEAILAPFPLLHKYDYQYFFLPITLLVTLPMLLTLIISRRSPFFSQVINQRSASSFRQISLMETTKLKYCETYTI